MGNELNEAQRYLDEGYSFRVKTVKNRRNITARKGQKERSLGPYTEEKWRRVTGKREGPRTVGLKTAKQVASPMSQLEEEIKALREIRMIHKLLNCKYAGRNGICTYWRISNSDLINVARDKLSDSIYEVYEDEKGNQVLQFRSIAYVCMECPAFKKREDKGNPSLVVGGGQH